MIKKLRHKFILVAMCAVSIVLFVIVGTINIANYLNINQDADRIINILVENNGYFPKIEKDKKSNNKTNEPNIFNEKMSPETPYENRYFTVTLISNGTILAINTGNIAAVSTSEATEYAQQTFLSKKQSGYNGMYRYSTITQSDGHIFMVFLDCSKSILTFQSFLLISVLVSLIGIFSVFILVFILSKIAIKPITESYAKQRQFITDASHELKTPITIISANTEVLEMESGENEWTKSIKNQVRHLSSLIQNLIDLSRMNEDNIKLLMIEFSVSDAIYESIGPFTVPAANLGKEIVFDIEEKISYIGDEKSIRRLATLLIDNAIKYSSDKSQIKIYLKKSGKNIIFSICNQIKDNIDINNLNMMFERFYRMDTSRNSKTGGYGIGLAVAKSIVLAHKGKIKAESNDGKSILITVKL